MLEKFGVLVLSEYLVEEEIEMCIRAFSDFYHELTPKHQKRINFNWVDGLKSDHEKVSSLMRMNDIPNRILNRLSYSEKSNIIRDSSLLLHPSAKNLKVVIPDAFSFGLPIIAIDSQKTKDYLDVSCGMILEGQSIEQLITEITGRLDMLYHDQEVLKLLEKGAYDQYEKKFGWGLKEFRRPLF